MILEVLCVIFILILWYIFGQNHKTSMKGPQGWPLIGNTLQIDPNKPYVTLTKWAQQYGDIYKVSLGGTTFVVVTGAQLLHETLKLGHTHVQYRGLLTTFNGSDIAFHKENNYEYKKKRKMLLSCLKLHDLKNIENITMDIVKDLIEECKAVNENEMDPIDLIHDSMIQTLQALLFYTKIERHDEQFSQIKRWIKLFVRGLSPVDGGLLDLMPWLRFCGNPTYKLIIQGRQCIMDMYTKWKSGYWNGEIKECWFRTTLENMEETQELTDTQLMMICGNLFGGGTGTSVPMIGVFLNIMIHYPHVQQAIQKEIDKITGNNREIRLSDKHNLPYTRACILENLRYQSVVPMVLRTATHDMTLAGHNIPKGTILLCNMWGSNHNPKLWPDPFLFKPERFLTEDGNLLLPGECSRKDLFVFGGGPRTCPGEVFGLSRLFLFIANILQKFAVLPAATIEEQATVHPEWAFDFGGALCAKPFKIRLQNRVIKNRY